MRGPIALLLEHPWFYELYQRLVRRGQVIERTLQSELAPLPGPLLDFACGSGLYSRLFSSRGYIGVDLSLAYLTFARRGNPQHRFGVMDVQHLGLRSDSVHAALAVGLFHHLSDDEAMLALAEALRVMRSGGVMVVIDLIPPLSRFHLLGHALVRLDRGQYARTMEDYELLFGRTFAVTNSYTIRTGPYDLGVFVMTGAD